MQISAIQLCGLVLLLFSIYIAMEKIASKSEGNLNCCAFHGNESYHFHNCGKCFLFFVIPLIRKLFGRINSVSDKRNVRNFSVRIITQSEHFTVRTFSFMSILVIVCKLLQL